MLTTIETRLTEEVLSVSAALQRFGAVTQDISKGLPDSAGFGKAITRLLSLLSFQFSDALLKDLDAPLLLSDGGEYIEHLGLSLNDAFREISLEGRKFLAVALLDERLSNRSQGSNG